VIENPVIFLIFHIRYIDKREDIFSVKMTTREKIPMEPNNLLKILIIALSLLFVLNCPVFADSTETNLSPDLKSDDLSILPSGNLPVVYLEGSPYQMGYSYGIQAAPSIAAARDNTWAIALLKHDRKFVLDKLALIADSVRNNITDFSYDEFIRGITEGAQTQGYSVTPTDIYLINSMFSLESPPGSPPTGCTNSAVWGDRTDSGEPIVSSNYDYHRSLINGYTNLIVAYPDGKHAFVSTGVPGRLSNSFQMNDAGVARTVSKGPSSRKEDSAFQVTDFFLGPYVVMSASDADTAKDIILSMPLSGGSIHLVADKKGKAYVIETTAALKAVRTPGENGEDDYLISTNFFLNETMKPAQKPWDPKLY